MTDINDFMKADEKIDELPDIGVMDLYVREKLMSVYMKEFRSKPEGFNHWQFKKAENTLSNMSQEGVRCWAIEEVSRGILSQWVREIGVKNRSEDFTVTCFDKITNPDWGRDKRIRMARQKLKKDLSGSLGMPNDKVIRDRLKDY